MLGAFAACAPGAPVDFVVVRDGVRAQRGVVVLGVPQLAREAAELVVFVVCFVCLCVCVLGVGGELANKLQNKQNYKTKNLAVAVAGDVLLDQRQVPQVQRKLGALVKALSRRREGNGAPQAAAAAAATATAGGGPTE